MVLVCLVLGRMAVLLDLSRLALPALARTGSMISAASRNRRMPQADLSGTCAGCASSVCAASFCLSLLTLLFVDSEPSAMAKQLNARSRRGCTLA